MVGQVSGLVSQIGRTIISFKTTVVTLITSCSRFVLATTFGRSKVTGPRSPQFYKQTKLLRIRIHRMRQLLIRRNFMFPTAFAPC